MWTREKKHILELSYLLHFLPTDLLTLHLDRFTIFPIRCRCLRYTPNSKKKKKKRTQQFWHHIHVGPITRFPC